MINTLLQHKILIAWVAAILLFAVFAGIAHANPSFWPRFRTTGTGSTATTTVNYIKFGIGTTTIVYDSFNPNDASLKADSALVVFQFTATTTIATPKMNARVEYALDTGTNCQVTPRACDWYPASAAVNSSPATTTIMTGNFADMQFSLATSTTDQGGSSFYNSGATSTIMQSFAIDTPTRFVRVKFYMPSGGGNGSLWAAIQAAKQIHE